MEHNFKVRANTSQDLHIAFTKRKTSPTFFRAPVSTVDLRTERAFEMKMPENTRQMLRNAIGQKIVQFRAPPPYTPTGREIFYKHNPMRRFSTPREMVEGKLHLNIIPSTEPIIANDFRLFSGLQFAGAEEMSVKNRRSLISRIVEAFLQKSCGKEPLAIVEDYVKDIVVHASWEPENSGILSTEDGVLREIALRNFKLYKEQVCGILGQKEGEETIKQILYIKYQKAGSTEIRVSITENLTMKRFIMMTMDIYNRMLLENIKCK